MKFQLTGPNQRGCDAFEPDTQRQEDAQAVKTENVLRTCLSCGRPIRDCGTPAYLEWCDSIRRLLVLKDVQPEQCHRSCFLGTLTGQTASSTASTLTAHLARRGDLQLSSSLHGDSSIPSLRQRR